MKLTSISMLLFLSSYCLASNLRSPEKRSLEELNSQETKFNVNSVFNVDAVHKITGISSLMSLGGGAIAGLGILLKSRTGGATEPRQRLFRRVGECTGFLGAAAGVGGIVFTHLAATVTLGMGGYKIFGIDSPDTNEKHFQGLQVFNIAGLSADILGGLAFAISALTHEIYPGVEKYAWRTFLFSAATVILTQLGHSINYITWEAQ